MAFFCPANAELRQGIRRRAGYFFDFFRILVMLRKSNSTDARSRHATRLSWGAL
jgi:hypothetical protein